MQFKDVVGHDDLKRKMLRSISDNRVSHAQLFYGPEGTHKLGLVLAYAQYLNCENPSETDSCGICPTCIKYNNFAHPDLHFIFPTVNVSSSDKSTSENYTEKWISYLKSNHAHVSLSSWVTYAWEENKRASITVRDASRMIEKINLKTYEGKLKVFVVWMVEKWFHAAAPKLLKTIEEPPANSLILMITEDYENVLNTIRSRSQLIKIFKYPNDIIRNTLVDKYEVSAAKAANIARYVNGNFYKALEESKEISDFDNTSNYIDMMRSAFQVMQKGGGIDNLDKWVIKISKKSRDEQINFLKYSIELTRQNFIKGVDESMVSASEEEMGFMKNFSPFINSKNIDFIFNELNKSILHIERNGYSLVIFMDMVLRIGSVLKR
ncbi:MAG: ATP-binding protein [Bacteroidales bacterium]|jgi:DNA polymerase-3 subunit delta'|nr:hypothetical protein [Bacteroidales bacterium]